ncbi:MAG: YdcF family protein [Magnetococcales bacterium]|nr:YdcF family protein [Magnetococcales bacterium]MBF0421175.1 YdcF family protein [Magnetococcales bacterium]
MLAKIVTFLISPLGTSLFLALVGWILTYRKQYRWALRVNALAILWLLLWSMPLASRWLRGVIESPFPLVAIENVPTAQAIVVLGGGIIPSQQKGNPPNLNQAGDRMWHAARLYHAGKAPILILSGGNFFPPYLTSEAEAMRIFMHDLGVPDNAMILEDRSRTTKENALYTLPMLQERHIHSVLLVTSAMHMRRALLLFNTAGIQVIPTAIDHEGLNVSDPTSYSVLDWHNAIPDSGSLEGSGRAIKEWVGPLVGR